MPYVLLPHTADLRARIEGGDLSELYGAAVDLVRDTLVGESLVRAVEKRRLDLAPDLAAEERLFRFVRELLYLFDAEGFVPARLDDVQALTVWGEPYDSSRHRLEHQVKAVTRHGFVFEARPEGFGAELLFDL